MTTASPQAQAWFDQGLMWNYGFNHEEAATCFSEAAKADPDCAMAYWGLAYVIGPNYNRAWETYDLEAKQALLDKAHSALHKAQSLSQNTSPAEAALIKALGSRYPKDPEVEDFSDWNDAFAAAMRQVHRDFPGDLDICTIFADAMMNRTPWQLWDLTSGQVAEAADTDEIISVIETALKTLKGAWDHAGLLHLYIHVMEMSPHPERALRHGDKLRQLVPDAGHLLHMPTHIDILCGNYQDVVERNSEAIIANRRYYNHRGGDNFYSFYRCHDYHFKTYGAMFLGQPSIALEAAQELTDTLPEGAIRSLGDFLEFFVSIKQHVQIRFGQWQQIIDEPLPADAELYCYTTAIMRYARTIAFANLHEREKAATERLKFDQARQAVHHSRMVLNNKADNVLALAEQMLAGELEYHNGNHALGLDHLRRAVELDDNLEYDEPWGWMQPARHALGALLLDQGHYKEAEAVYRADLGLDDTLARACQHPNNVWSLHGLNECLIKRGEKAEATHIKRQLDKALARTEIPIRASCFCRGPATSSTP